ncbi:MAG: hypothetical protein EXS48_03385 [Candidatus Staskawiczbacteria bacterium]|nr:hypothetical protein [Candidatus Staskawiczbacteria bacterium]
MPEPELENGLPSKDKPEEIIGANQEDWEKKVDEKGGEYYELKEKAGAEAESGDLKTPEIIEKGKARLYELYEISENERLLKKDEARKELFRKAEEHVRELNGKTPEEWEEMRRQSLIQKAGAEIARRNKEGQKWWQVWK